MALIRIDSLGDVPLLYDRDPASNYGTTGYRVRPYIDNAFAKEADRAFHQIFQTFEAGGLGHVKATLFAGIGRSGGGTSYHHRNRAFDLDGFIFASGQKWVANSFPARPHLYLAIEAVLRQTFGTILTYDYNPSHRDHIHFDNGDRVGFRPHSKSRVLFLQNAARHLFDVMVSVDGVYGPETQLAERAVRKELGLGGFSNLANWIAFLDASADIALDRAVENEAWEMSA